MMSLPFSRSVAISMLAGLVLLAAAPPAQAQPKIATVDLRKIFEDYFKTKQADAQLRERGAEAEKQYKGWLDDYQKANDEYKKLVESANDQAVSADERDKRKKAAESKLLELNELEKTLAQFKRETQVRFEEQKRRMRDGIVREIRDIVNTRARQGNYTLVLDTSAESVNMAPFILFNAGQHDLTAEILAQMNANAPPGFLDAEKSKETSLTLPDQSKERESERPARGFRR